MTAHLTHCSQRRICVPDRTSGQHRYQTFDPVTAEPMNDSTVYLLADMFLSVKDTVLYTVSMILLS
jgi:hypothetical protein